MAKKQGEFMDPKKEKATDTQDGQAVVAGIPSANVLPVTLTVSGVPWGMPVLEIGRDGPTIAITKDRPIVRHIETGSNGEL